MKSKFFNKRGSALTEYAIILSFVAAIAFGFVGDRGLNASIANAMDAIVKIFNGNFGKASDILDGTTQLLYDKYLSGNTNADYGDTRVDVLSIIGSDNKLIGLDYGEYELVVDRKKLDEIAKTYGINNIETNFWVCMLLYDNEAGTGKANFDTSGQYLNRPKENQNLNNFTQIIEADKTTFRFTVDSSTGNYLGLNIGKNLSDKTNPNDVLCGIGANYNNILTLNKVK
ncbi:MAG: hypothetical protein ACI3XH_08495 [Phascolarctobacterium sp.]